MSIDLIKHKCVPCEGGEPPLTDLEIKQFAPQVPHWQVQTVSEHPALVRTLTFKNFAQAMKFVNQVADIAEGEGHHPDLHIHWNIVRIENWTHAIGGLHQNDFILAAKIDQIKTG